MKRNLLLVLIGVVGIVVIVGGCAKRVPPSPVVQEEVVKEEKVVPPSQTGEPSVPPVKQPPIGESEVAARQEAVRVTAELATIYFDFDKYNIREDMRAPLEANARWLLSRPEVAITIEGHADERGTNEYNLALGERRARATKQFLVALGVDENRISTISFGEERPVCRESEESCYWKNRRSHFVIRGQ